MKRSLLIIVFALALVLGCDDDDPTYVTCDCCVCQNDCPDPPDDEEPEDDPEDDGDDDEDDDD